MPSVESLHTSRKDGGRFTPIEPTMTITEAGLVLGAATVLAKRQINQSGLAALAVTGNEERILGLLSVAYGRAIDPGVIKHIRRASRALGRGEDHIARIHLAYARLPRLDDEITAAYRLRLANALLNQGISPRELLKACGLGAATDILKWGFNPDEPRVPAGNPDGGQWTTEDEVPPVVPAATHRASVGNPDRFFDTAYEKIKALAQRLGIDETWLLGLAAHESGYLNDHNRQLNDLFGVTHGGGRNVRYDSIDAAIGYWVRRYGSAVRNATSANDFVERLYRTGYNIKTKEWRALVLAVINSIPRRLESWKSKRNI